MIDTNRLKTSNTVYRPDIDGIRALAVLSVFIFHLHPNLLPGGFLGVDIFFVISGFLITGIIVRENNLKTFSFTHFYARRIKRIFPPLFVVLLLSGFFATFLLTPETYVNFMKSARYASGQLANIFFAREVDYFSESFSGQPLLHTWSLGVEEQFYLFWPLLIFGCYRLLNTSKTAVSDNTPSYIHDCTQTTGSCRTLCSDENGGTSFIAIKIAGAFLLICLVSFGLCYFLAQTNQNLAFYMFYSRAFEFCIGGFIALKILPNPVSPWSNGLIGAMGLLLLCYSLYFIEEEHLGRSFLQFSIILPCAGTALIIHANWQKGIINKILATQLPTSIGKISYSLYLYHWPVIAFWKSYIHTNELRSVDSFGIILVTFFLSILSYFLIEKPTRKSILPDYRTLVFAFIAIFVFSFIFKDMEKYEIATWRITPYLNTKTTAIKSYDPGCTETIKSGLIYYKCQSIKKTAKPVIALVGDSHSPHYLRSVTTWAKNHGYNVKYLGVAGCPMLLGDVHIKSTIAEHERQCDIAQSLLETQIVGDPNVELILMAQRFDLFYDGKGAFNTTRKITFKDSTEKVVEDHTSYYDDRLSFTVNAIRKAGKDLIFLKQVPIFSSIQTCNWKPLLEKLSNQERSCSFDRGFIKKWQQPSIDFIDRFAAVNQVDVFDPMPYFSSPLVDGLNIYRDKDHINEHGSLFLVPFFEKDMNAIMARKKTSSLGNKSSAQNDYIPFALSKNGVCER
jgi:peptidoglycan/LPS O-acetylase OafA/YrhL